MIVVNICHILYMVNYAIILLALLLGIHGCQEGNH